MISRFVQIKQSIVLVGLTLALLVAGAAPLLGGSSADAAKKRKRATAASNLSAQLTQSFSNPDGIAIADSMPATAYPSTISVSGFETEITDVAVTLQRFSHTAPGDVDMLLVGPAGQTAIFMSDAGGLNIATNVTLTFDDSAASILPAQLTTGTFRPTNNPPTDDIFPPPAPTPQTNNAALAAFNGTNPNGTWSLYVVDRGAGFSGSVSGWSLLITVADKPPTPPTPDSGTPRANSDTYQARAGKTLNVPAAGVLENDNDPDGDPLTAIVANGPKKGSLSLQADGSFAYKPKKKAKGVDSFTYLAQDPGGLEALATVEITIKGKKGKGGKKGKK
jgi:subtilisin-like proprotein convertase family protein